MVFYSNDILVVLLDREFYSEHYLAGVSGTRCFQWCYAIKGILITPRAISEILRDLEW